MAMQIDKNTLQAWQAQANDVWEAIQSRLAPFDELVYSRVAPYVSVPDMPEGLLTALAIPVVLTALVVLATLFDMFATLLLRVTFRYRRRPVFSPGLWAIYDTLSAALTPRYRLLPWVTLHDLIRLDNGSQYQRSVHTNRLTAYHADAVICDRDTGLPVQVIILLPKGRPKRALKKRHRHIVKACKRTGIPFTYLSMRATSVEQYPDSLAGFLQKPTATPAV